MPAETGVIPAPTADATLDDRMQSRSIPSLDGLRALAVVAVVLSHLNGWQVRPLSPPLRSLLLLLGQGGLGVSAFFIISGFLITTLLLNERERAGAIDLKRFYFRRTLRIFPAFYVYLVAAAVVGKLAAHAIPASALLSSAAYLSDYFPYAWIHPVLPSWSVAHTWSLSVEEQFYLLWPFLLVKLTPRRAMRACVAVVCLTPFLRLATVVFLPVYAMAEQWSRLFHTNADVLALGCLLALAMREPGMPGRMARCFHPLLLAGCVLFLGGNSFLVAHSPMWVSALGTITLSNLCLAVLILFFVLRPNTVAGRALNWGPMRHIGVISYSLYLWQQLFLGPYSGASWVRSLLGLVCCAELSFWLVERPFLKLRGRLERRWFAREAPEKALAGRTS